MMGMGQRPMPKGNIQPLWDLLGVDFTATQIVGAEVQPASKKFQEFPGRVRLCRHGLDENKVFNQNDPISSGLQSLLFIFPGSIRKLNASPLTFEKLVTTGTQTDDRGLRPDYDAGVLRRRRRTESDTVSRVPAASH